MKKGFILSLALAFLLSLCAAAFATSETEVKADPKAEVKAFVNRAVEIIKKEGKEKAFKAFEDQKGEFVKESYYITANDFKGKCLSHGSNAKLIGKDFIELKDADGVAFMVKFVETAKSKEGEGWVDYKWTDPATKTIRKKSSFVKKAGDDFFVTCGYYVD